MACVDAGESGTNMPASMYMPFMLSSSLALRMELSTSSSPTTAGALPVIWLNTSSSERSCMAPESDKTKTELSFTFGLLCSEASMPMSDMMPRNIITAETAIMPVTVARVYFRKSFIINRCFYTVRKS